MKKWYMVGALVTVALAGCSSGDFDVGIPADPGSDTGAPDTNPTTEAGGDTGIGNADTGVNDTGAVQVDSGSVDSGSTPTDTGSDETSVDSGSASDSGTDSGDSGTVVTETGADEGGLTGCPTQGVTRCNGDQLEYCDATNTWSPKGGVCNYGCVDGTPTKAATCSCTAPSGRFVTVTDSRSPDGFAYKDTKTGLIWADSDYTPDPTLGYNVSWTDARDACSGFYGPGAWRVPTKAELDGIVAQVGGPGPWAPDVEEMSCRGPDMDLALKFSPSTANPRYWSSDKGSNSISYMAIDMYNGEWYSADGTTGAHVRCVHN